MSENAQVRPGVPVSPGVPQVSPGDTGKAPSCVPRARVSAPRRSPKGDTGAAGQGDTETGPTRGGHPKQAVAFCGAR